MTQLASKQTFVIGAGLAGSEAALVLANFGFEVVLIEQKPTQYSAVHRLPGAAELVCSNSFKSLEHGSAHGLLKAELMELQSPLMQIAMRCRIPGGKALTVDRELFSQCVTEALKNHPRITYREEECRSLPTHTPTLVASGPLSSDALMKDLLRILEDDGLYFYDATSPVITLESLEMEKFFWGARHDPFGSDYLNLPLTKEQYFEFRNDLLTAEKTEAHHPEESLKFFEGCLPIEVLAERGEDTLAFSCMRPIGLNPENLKPRPYAVIQFRREKAAGELLNMVGFQTRMKWPEQERVFRKLPGMGNAEFVRLGAMHRNTFINAPKHLNEKLELIRKPGYFFAGQLIGSEGYTEAVATGHYAALQMAGFRMLPELTAMRSLVRYLNHSDPLHFQPMNFNFGLLPDASSQISDGSTLKGRRLGKSERNALRASQALSQLKQWKEENWSNGGSATWMSKSSSGVLARKLSEQDDRISNTSING